MVWALFWLTCNTSALATLCNTLHGSLAASMHSNLGGLGWVGVGVMTFLGESMKANIINDKTPVSMPIKKQCKREKNSTSEPLTQKNGATTANGSSVAQHAQGWLHHESGVRRSLSCCFLICSYICMYITRWPYKILLWSAFHILPLNSVFFLGFSRSWTAKPYLCMFCKRSKALKKPCWDG